MAGQRGVRRSEERAGIVRRGARPTRRRPRGNVLDRALQILDHLQQTNASATPAEFRCSVGAAGVERRTVTWEDGDLLDAERPLEAERREEFVAEDAGGEDGLGDVGSDLADFGGGAEQCDGKASRGLLAHEAFDERVDGLGAGVAEMADTAKECFAGRIGGRRPASTPTPWRRERRRCRALLTRSSLRRWRRRARGRGTALLLCRAC